MAPFKPATSDFNAVVENMYMTAFIKMQNDGVLPKDKPLGHLSPAETAELAAQTKRDEAILIRELVLPGNVKMELPRCPAGTFTMGSPADETGCRNNETPHQVTLSKPFWMGKTEVTQAQWRSLMGNNPSKSEGDDLPVETVSSVEAEAFCRKLTLHLQEKNLLSHDYECRLPTEAEWEYACRAGSGGRYAGSDRVDDLGWFRLNSEGKVKPVSLKKPNAWGLYDMHGNVSEWCLDTFAPYPSSAATDPIGPCPAPNLGRVYRGGSWNLSADRCSSAIRAKANPNRRYAHIGFRVVITPTVQN